MGSCLASSLCPVEASLNAIRFPSKRAGGEKWSDRNILKFSKEECKVWGRNSSRHEDVLGTPSWEQLCRKGPEGPGGHQVERVSNVSLLLRE